VPRLAAGTALITGASRNIGKSIALAFATVGADLLLNTRVDEEELAAACVFLPLDDSSYITGDRILCMGGRFIG
jgi:NAD(P)-dependent dehydrogenase (short-subunit alcohol dehydrogenase family)